MSCTGELAVGLIYGAPLAGILEDAWQSAFTVVGYLGLVILVLEGGPSEIYIRCIACQILLL